MAVVVEKYKLVRSKEGVLEEREIDIIKYSSAEYKMRVDGKYNYEGFIVMPEYITNTLIFLVQKMGYTLYIIDDERMQGSPVPFDLITDDEEPIRRVRRKRVGLEEKPKKRVRRRIW